MRRVAASAGVRGRSWHLNVKDLDAAPFPVIAHVRGNHFVVVQGQPTPGVLQVDDPAHMGFVCMVLLFHAYLRGNLLGLDGGAAMHYFLVEGSVERALRSKNDALTAVQLVMVASVLVPAALRPGEVLGSPLAWAVALGSTCAALVAAEVVGTATSLLYPEPIDRKSIYSGGFTIGAVAVPAAQIVVFATFGIVFLLIQNGRIPTAVGWAWCVAIPAIALLARPTLLARLSWRLGDRRREALVRALRSLVP